MIQTGTDGNLTWDFGNSCKSCERDLGSEIYRMSHMLGLRDDGCGEWLAVGFEGEV